MGTLLTRVRREFIELNLFKSGLNEVEVVQQERWSTRLYLILLIIALVILVIYTALGMQTVHVVVNDPSLSTYQTLQLKYTETLQCPCSQIAVKYENFIQMQPIFHPVCSSAFVSEEWILATFGTNVSYVWPMDVRTVISAHAQFLRSFCTTTQQGISFVLIGILSSSLVSAEVLPLPLVQKQVDTQKTTLQSAGKWQILVLITFLQLTMTSSHLMTGLGTNSFLYMLSKYSSTANVGINSYQLNSNSSPCYCLTTDNCPVPGAIYPSQQLPTFGQYNVETLGVGSIPVKGIEVGCFALESVLASTLECYYDSNCIELLVSNPERFPPLKSTSSDSFPQDTIINTLLNALMVEQWLVNMSFANYYSECAPKTCSYSFNQQNNFLIIFTTIIALIGGLNTILRLFVPLIIQTITQIKQQLKPQNTHIQRVVIVWTEQQSKLRQAKEKVIWLWLKIRMLNLFDSNSNNPLKQKHERYTTRLYILFVTIAFVILLSYTIATKETTVYTIQKPSQDTYEKLYAEYSSTIACTCKNISIPYSYFITIQASYHQVCSSSFISPSFFAQLAMIREDAPIYPGDFILMGVDYFQWLTTFCALSQLVFSNQLAAFQTELFVNNELLTRDVFEIQANQLADFFISDVQFYFAGGITETRELLGFSQPISATSIIRYILSITTTSSGSQVRIEPLNFFSDCSCLSDPTSCSDDAAFYSYIPMNNSFYPIFKIPGIRIACSPMESLLQSNLACWYSSDCYETVIQYWQNRTYYLQDLPPLLNNTIPSQYNSSTSLHLIINQLMVEDWSKEISYDSYYSQCAPLYCTYSVTQRKDAILIITLLLGLFGGLNVVLKLLTPLVIKLGSWLITHGRNFSTSFRRHLRELPSDLIHLNLFFHRHRSSELTKKKEHHTTRLYLILLIMSMLILLFYYSLSYSIVTITIDNPTKQMYEKLRQSNDISFLQCPCTHFSITYGTFVQANTTLNNICSSPFITEAWIYSIFGDGYWSYTDPTDLMGRGVIYFQGLHSLCYLFQENTTAYVSNFLASSFISAQVLSESELITQVNESVEQVKASSRADHSSMYNFARDLENANQLMTIYSTNWVYASINYDPNLIGLPIPLEPVSHGNCSCAVSSNCVEPITLNGQIVPGLLLGCLPLESLFQSTLICLYNQTCINQININHLNVTPLIPPMDSELSINRTVGDLVDNALDLTWSVEISYANFFDQCSPASCLYSVNQRRDVIEIIVTLLGLYGGLTVALRFIVPYIIDLVHRIAFNVQQGTNMIHPTIPERF